MARNRFDYTFDSDTELKDTSAAIAVSAAAQVGGADKVLDLGAGRMDGVVVIDVTALNVAAGDEATVFFQLSDGGPTTALFEAGNWIAGASKIFGDVTLNGSKVDSVIGHYELPVSNEINGTVYRYARLYTLIAAAGSLTYRAFLAPKA
jgi:hypothetical protein